MSKKWDEMTPEQQRAIGEAAVKDYNETPSGTSLADSLTMKAVRDAEFPTWSAYYGGMERSDGRRISIGFRGGEPLKKEEYEAMVEAAISAPNAHEREKRGLK